MTTSLEILDDGELVAITFADILKYHGTSSIGGVAHGFKVMERALPLLAGGAPPDRYDVGIVTAFPGPGARDAFEMVTRAVMGGRYAVDPDLAPDAHVAPEGRYFFRFSLAATGATVDLDLRPGLVDPEFVALVKQETKSPDDEVRIRTMKFEMADRLMSLPAEQVYDVAN